MQSARSISLAVFEYRRRAPDLVLFAFFARFRLESSASGTMLQQDLLARHTNLRGSHIDAHAIEGAEKGDKLFGIVDGKGAGNF